MSRSIGWKELIGDPKDRGNDDLNLRRELFPIRINLEKLLFLIMYVCFSFSFSIRI